MWCPFCEQGEVRTYRVSATSDVVQVCVECDSAWPEQATPEYSSAVDVTEYLASRGVDSDPWNASTLMPIGSSTS